MWKKSKAYIIGAGKSGLAAASFLINHGAKVWLHDQQDISKLDKENLEYLEKQGVILDIGNKDQSVIQEVDFILQSPGVPLELPILVEAAKAGIPIISEIELGYLTTKAPIIGITGSNGKTTTTTLLGNIMKLAYNNVFIGGNIGTPFILEAEQLNEEDWSVLELSSFQLESVKTFRPKIGVILNLTPDHLDRHKSFENYCAAKWRIAQYQNEEDYLLLNYDDCDIREKDLDSIKSQVIYFSAMEILQQGVWVNDGIITVSFKGESIAILSIADIQIPGKHNLENILAAVGAAFLAGISPNLIAQGIEEFQGVEHRLEKVLESDGVLYINDSKGTNTDATIKAIDAFERPIILIAGGMGKGGSYQAMAEKIKEKVKLLVLIGEDSDKIELAAQSVDYQQIIRAANLEAAVISSIKNASAGDVVLLSPACASYDMFKNYSQRGDIYKELVKMYVATRGE